MDKKGAVLNPIDIIAGILIIIAGAVTILGKVNLGTALASLGLIIEAIKILIKSGP